MKRHFIAPRKSVQICTFNIARTIMQAFAKMFILMIKVCNEHDFASFLKTV